MPIELNATHDPARRSFVESANAADSDFPIQNLPFGVFDDGKGARGGVALGDRIIDLAALAAAGRIKGPAAEAAIAASGGSLQPLFEQPIQAVSQLRAALSDMYRSDAGERAAAEALLVPMAGAELQLPARPVAFTDFCCSADHIRRMASRGGGPPSKPGAWATLPVAYNGRASSVRVSGTGVVRPIGQIMPQGSETMQVAPEPMLDFELEFGAWLRGAANPLGEAVPLGQAEERLFGCCLVNDWSARAIQFYEMILGPHLGKSFITTVSPWVVTMEALAPFRVAARGRVGDEPEVPTHLSSEFDREAGALNVELTAHLSAGGAETTIVRTNAAELFWTLAQMVTHQASGGAPLEPGDLIATGTVSGAADEARACMVELTRFGTEPVTLSDGTQRTMLEDGDTLTLRGRAVAEGYVSIGFGDCAGTIQPARNAA